MKQIVDSFPLFPSGELRFPRDRPVLLVFYPGDFTPTCTKQLCEYRDNYADFKKLNCDLIGVSKDSMESHQKMHSQFNLPFPLISDPDKDLIKRFGMKGLIPKRGYALLGLDGNVLWQTTDLVPVFFTTTAELLRTVSAILKNAGFAS
jgi:peroxiredoxin Q/BCP